MQSKQDNSNTNAEITCSIFYRTESASGYECGVDCENRASYCNGVQLYCIGDNTNNNACTCDPIGSSTGCDNVSRQVTLQSASPSKLCLLLLDIFFAHISMVY